MGVICTGPPSWQNGVLCAIQLFAGVVLPKDMPLGRYPVFLARSMFQLQASSGTPEPRMRDIHTRSEPIPPHTSLPWYWMRSVIRHQPLLLLYPRLRLLSSQIFVWLPWTVNLATRRVATAPSRQTGAAANRHQNVPVRHITFPGSTAHHQHHAPSSSRTKARRNRHTSAAAGNSTMSLCCKSHTLFVWLETMPRSDAAIVLASYTTI